MCKLETLEIIPAHRSQVIPNVYHYLELIRIIVTEIDLTPTQRFLQTLQEPRLTSYERLTLDSPALELVDTQTLDDIAALQLTPPFPPVFRFYDDTLVGLSF